MTGRFVHQRWNAIAWPLDAALGVVLASVALQAAWQFVWTSVLDERWWPPEIASFVIKPLVGVLMGAGWLRVVLGQTASSANRDVFSIAGILRYDWRHRREPGTVAGYVKTAALAAAAAAFVYGDDAGAVLAAAKTAAAWW